MKEVVKLMRYEVSDGKSHKFWAIERKGSALRIRYGKIATAGQSLEKKLDTSEAAKREHDKLVRAKTRKGYVAVAPATSGRSTAPIATCPRSDHCATRASWCCPESVRFRPSSKSRSSMRLAPGTSTWGRCRRSYSRSRAYAWPITVKPQRIGKVIVHSGALAILLPYASGAFTANQLTKAKAGKVYEEPLDYDRLLIPATNGVWEIDTYPFRPVKGNDEYEDEVGRYGACVMISPA